MRIENASRPLGGFSLLRAVWLRPQQPQLKRTVSLSPRFRGRQIRAEYERRRLSARFQTRCEHLHHTSSSSPVEGLPAMADNDDLCQPCKGLNIEALRQDGGYIHVASDNELYSSSETCPMCKLIHDSLRGSNDKSSDDPNPPDTTVVCRLMHSEGTQAVVHVKTGARTGYIRIYVSKSESDAPDTFWSSQMLILVRISGRPGGELWRAHQAQDGCRDTGRLERSHHKARPHAVPPRTQMH